MTERHWVDADEALEDAATREGARSDGAHEGACLDRNLDEKTAEELREDGHQAGD